MSTQLPWEALGNNPTTGTLFGLNLPKPRKAVFMNRTGSTLAVEDVCQIDVSNTDGTSTAWDQTTAGITSNLIFPRAGLIAHKEAGIVVVITKLLPPVTGSTPGADNNPVEGIWYGPVDAKVVDAGGSISFGEQLTVNTTGEFDGVKASGERIFAIAIEADASVTAVGGDSIRVFLTNGYSGLEAVVGGPGGTGSGLGAIPT